MVGRYWVSAVVVFGLPSLAAASENHPCRTTVLPLAVDRGTCRAVVPSAGDNVKHLLVVGSTARKGGPFTVNVRTAASVGPVQIDVAVPTTTVEWQRRVRETAERQAYARRVRSPGRKFPPADSPAPWRVFHLFVKEGDFDNPANYVEVVGELRGVGKHCQVYVDRDHRDREGIQPTVEAALATFDERIYPRACRELGRTLDVDRDGRFTILFTGWLNRLSSGKVSLGGFVRGSDFHEQLGSPFGNRADMLYLNTDLRPGPHLDALLAHEFTHAVVFSEHVFAGYLPDAPRQDEESWLNEALAHLNEDFHGAGWSNLDYRIAAFLAEPERYQLVVSDYYAAGLWRSHGHRGATYLFLRWCVDQYGADLVGRLVRSSLAGVSNLEVATQRPFAELFRDWTVALALGGSGLLEPALLESVNLRRPLETRLLCGCRTVELALHGSQATFQLAGTSAGVVLLHSPASAHSTLHVTAPVEAELQVTLISLPADMPRLSLCCEDVDRELRLVLTAHDGDVTLEGAAWECLRPTVRRAEDTSYRDPESAAALARAWFGEPMVQSGEIRVSPAISRPGPAKAGWIFKVVGATRAGQRVAAHAILAETPDD
jgi:hypothetical protein